MGINYNQLKDYVVIPTLKEIELYSDAAVNLVLGTFAQESHMGTYIKQVNGPACGIAQCEKLTYDDMWKRFPQYFRVAKIYEKPPFESLIWDLRLSTIVCRIKYYSIRENLPDDSIEALARYWKRWYNTVLGKGNEKEFIYNYMKYCH